jgi:hypothetical protein
MDATSGISMLRIILHGSLKSKQESLAPPSACQKLQMKNCRDEVTQ